MSLWGTKWYKQCGRKNGDNYIITNINSGRQNQKLIKIVTYDGRGERTEVRGRHRKSKQKYTFLYSLIFEPYKYIQENKTKFKNLNLNIENKWK